MGFSLGSENMPLFINKESSMPLYLQVKEQIKYLILTGKLIPGSKLPSGRQLADFLHINRATINNALNELENEGYLRTEKGIGTYVAEHPSLGLERDHEKFRQIILKAMAEANDLGFTTDEFVTAAFVLAEYNRAGQEEGFYAVFVECNEPVLNDYKRDIEESLKIKVEPILIDRLKNMDTQTRQLIQRSGMVITTFTHLHEVRSLLKNIAVEIIGVTAGPDLELLFRFSQIEPDAKITIVMVTNREAVEVAQSIKDSGIKNSLMTVTSYEEKEKMIKAIKEAQLIVASSAIAAEIKKYVREDQELITYLNSLDLASKTMLQKVFADLIKNERVAYS